VSFTIFGRLRGYLCDDCDEALEGVVVRFYATDAPDISDRAVADPKETAVFVDVADEARAARLLAEATVAADGSYRATFPESYEGRAVDVDLYCGNVPRWKPPKKVPEPIQLHLTTLQPRWRQTEEGAVAAYEYAVPARIWCGIRARLGAWVVCGTVTDCQSEAPIAGVVVKAFDADWLQDDALGSDTTDSAGHYRIDYNAEDFRRTPFSPNFNLELFAGPDLYFRVETSTGSPLLVEPRAEGRTPARENSGPCKCVHLCLTGGVVPDVIPTIPMFTKVGSYRIDPLDAHFTAAGTTTVGDLAFTGDIPLIGIMPDPLSPDAIEYRFLVDGTPFSDTQMGPTMIGELQYFAWNPIISAWVLRSVDFWANQPGAAVSIPQNAGPDLVIDVNAAVKAGGWIEAPRTDGLVPGGPGRFIPNGTLALLRTTSYTNEAFDMSASTPTPLDAGDSVPAAQRSTMPTFTIAFEARKLGTVALVGSDSLATIAFSNLQDTYTRHPYWAGSDVTTTGVASLGIAEMATSGGCAELGDTIHVLYTAYHPYVGQPTITFDGNPILPAAISPSVVGGEAVSQPGGDLVDISLLAKCAYILWLSVPLRLTGGYGWLGLVVQDHIAFCKE
jgi:hypothetical protein